MRRLSIIISAATLLLSSATHTAHADVPSIRPGSMPPGVTFADGWYTLYAADKLPDQLTNSRETIVQGTNGTGGTCEFKETLTATAANPTLEQEEAAINPATCQERVLLGTPPAGQGKISNSVPSPYAVCCGGGGDYEHKGHAFSKFYDCWTCGQHTVTSQTTWTDWWYNGSTVDYATNSKSNFLLWDGWYSENDYWNNNSYNSQYTVADSHEEDGNCSFPGCTCGFSGGNYYGPTETHYYHVAAYGWYNGSLSGYFDVASGGPCGWELGHSETVTMDY